MEGTETKEQKEIRELSENKNPYDKDCHNKNLWSEGYRKGYADSLLTPTTGHGITDHDLRILANDYVEKSHYEDADATSFAKGYRACEASMRLSSNKEGEKWISVEERLPNDQQEILFIVNGINAGIRKGSFLEKDQWLRSEIFCDGSFFRKSNISHWMPLPTPPNK